MKVKKIGDIPKPPVTEVINDFRIDSSGKNNITKEDIKVEPSLSQNISSSNKLYYIIGGSVIILVAFLLIYLFVFKHDDTENDSNVSQNPPSELNDLDLKQKELELKERELNLKREKLEREKQNKNTNVNYFIIDGYYQVGNTFCTITSNKNGLSAKWDKGSGFTKIVDDVQGEDVLYIEYDSHGKECGHFYFFNNFREGEYNRNDGVIFSVTKIR